MNADNIMYCKNKKSVNGFIIEIIRNVITWTVRKQSVVALSSTEAEYIILSMTVSECLGVFQVLGNSGIATTCVIYEGNESAIKH